MGTNLSEWSVPDCHRVGQVTGHHPDEMGHYAFRTRQPSYHVGFPGCEVRPQPHVSTLTRTHLLGPEPGTTASTLPQIHRWPRTKGQGETQRKVGIAFIEGRTPQGPAHGQVSVLPGISTCHQLKVSETCKSSLRGWRQGQAPPRPGAGWTGREGGIGQVLTAQMGQPVSLGHGGARTPWDRGGQQHPERISTG